MLPKAKKQEYNINDLVIVMDKGVKAVFKIRKIDSLKQVAETQSYRGNIKETSLAGTGTQGKIDIPLSAIIRKATQVEITKAEQINKLR